MPSLVTESLWQIPQACTRTRTSPAFGSGTSRVTNSIGPPFLTTCAYRPVNFGMAASPSKDAPNLDGSVSRPSASEALVRIDQILLAGRLLAVDRDLLQP